MRLEHWLYTIPLRLRSLFRRNRVEQELAEELQYHLERKTEEFLPQGMSQDDARHAAMRAMDGLELRKEQCRDTRGVNSLETLLQDLRFGLRMLRKSPGFTSVAVLTLALGIGANTAIFSITDASLRKNGDWYRLGAVVGDEPHRTERIFHFSVAEFVNISALRDIFEQAGALQWSNSALTSGTYPERVGCAHITSSVLSSPLHLGRNFLPGEDRPGGPPVAILSYEFWQGHFNGDSQILGKRVKLDETDYTIVGVTRPHESAFGSGVMVPLQPNLSDPDRSRRNLWVLVTLRPGVTWIQVEARLSVLARQMARDNRIAHPEYADLQLHFWSIYEAMTSGTRPALLIALAAAALLLIVACANVAGLLIARATTRWREVAIRLALGARRSRIVRQMLTEALLLAAAGALSGILFAYWSLPSIIHLIPASWLAVDPTLIRVNPRVLLFAVTTALLTGFFFGVAPAWLSSRAEPLAALNAGGQRMAGSRQSRISRDSLVACEIALALIMLVSSAWMLETYRNLQSIDLGFEPAHVLSLTISLPTSRYSSAVKIGSFFENALAHVEALPGVQDAALVSGLPMFDRSVDLTTLDFSIEGRPPENGSEPDNANFRVISPGYFDLIGAHLLRGRFFNPDDRDGQPPVAIINETMARQFWPGANLIGQRIHLTSAQTSDRENTVIPPVQSNPVVTIVGVVSDVKQIRVIDAPVRPEFYLPELQNAALQPELTMMVRSPMEPEKLLPAIRNAIRSLDPELPVYGVQPMTQVVADSYGPKRIVTVLLLFFAAAAVLLSILGIYSVIAYSVIQRSHEIGVRLALGAHPRDIQRLIIKQGLRLSLIGLGIGVVGALFVARFLTHSVSGVTSVGLLYKVSPWNPLPMLAVGCTIFVATLAACYIPARRAMRVDPMVALRHE